MQRQKRAGETLGRGMAGHNAGGHADVAVPGYDGFELIGRGGFATVYRARQIAYDRRVAVKIIDVDVNDEGVRRRIERERTATGRLTGHPNIVTILDSGFLDDGRPYLAMTLCPGGSLADRLAREGPLPVADVLRIGVKIAGALQTTHAHGVVHRDVKPENILVTPAGEPALSDFGVSTIADHYAQTRSTAAYTPQHAPPEVLLGQATTARSDVYSLGSALYQLLAGQPPFAAASTAGLAPFVDAVLRTPPPPLARSDVPESLWEILQKALAKDPADRFESALAFGEALREVQAALGLPRDDIPVFTPAEPVPTEPESAPAGGTETVLPPRPPTTAAASTAGSETILPPRPPTTTPAPAVGSETVLPPKPPADTPRFAVGSATVLGPPPDRSAATVPQSPPPTPAGRPIVWIAVGAVVVLLLLGSIAVALALSRSGDRDPDIAAGPSTSAPEATATTTVTSEATTEPTTEPSATPSPTDTGAGGPAPQPTGPAFASLRVTATCYPPSGQLTVEWALVRADNVQIYAPDGTNLYGGYGGANGSAEVEVNCTPGQSYVVRAVAQNQSQAGETREVRGTWQASPPVMTELSASDFTCGPTSGQVLLSWSSLGADEVRLSANGSPIPETAPSGYKYVYIPCNSGGTTTIRAVPRRGGVDGQPREYVVTWP
jgi:serine/threonine protein kinase